MKARRLVTMLALIAVGLIIGVGNGPGYCQGKPVPRTQCVVNSSDPATNRNTLKADIESQKGIIKSLQTRASEYQRDGKTKQYEQDMKFIEEAQARINNDNEMINEIDKQIGKDPLEATTMKIQEFVNFLAGKK